MKNSRFIISFLILGILASCSKGDNTNVVLDDSLHRKDKALSVRSQNLSRMIKIVELEGKPLIERLEEKNGKINVQKRYANELKNQHKRIEERLKEVSKDIKVVFNYYYSFNGMALSIPQKLEKKIDALSAFKKTHNFSLFKNPLVSSFAKKSKRNKNLNKLQNETAEVTPKIDSLLNSSNFIGANYAKEQGLTGEGIKVAVIDSGIDYTHKAFGGEGTVEAFNAVDASKEDSNFPTERVVGGYDFVGNNFDPSSVDPKKRIPNPDKNPLDQTGHGSHVAGTIGGKGDGIYTYDGVAPDVDLYAMKVFGGPTGSTAEYVVAKAIEVSFDPNGDFDISDRVDVINMSLGELYGTDESLYRKASIAAHKLGISVVAAAGNSGDLPFVVGMPGTVDENISVAASIDYSKHIIESEAVSFPGPEGSVLGDFSEAEGDKSVKLKDVDELKAEAVYLGIGKDIPEEVLSQLNGKIAVFDRGELTFADKFKNVASYGVVAAMIINTDEDLVLMQLDRVFGFPTVFVRKSFGDKLKTAINENTTLLDLKPKEKLRNEDLIDTIASFSSRGPRIQDAAFKPEISAPGYQIFSVDVGTGFDSQASNGTSMASPHIAGVVALAKEKFPNSTPDEFKSKLMNSAKFLEGKEEGSFLPVTFQGAGRVDIEAVLNQVVHLSPSGLSLGIVQVNNGKEITKRVTLKNDGDETISLSLSAKLSSKLSLMIDPEPIIIESGERKSIDLKFVLDTSDTTEPISEYGGIISFHEDDKIHAQLPILAIARKTSQVSLASATGIKNDDVDVIGSDIDLVLVNKGGITGKAAIFNFLFEDEKRPENLDPNKTNECDLAKVGYRIVDKTLKLNEQELDVTSLQFGVKLHGELTNWSFCDVSVLIDTDKDGNAEFELAGNPANSIAGLQGDAQISVLLDIAEAKKIRSEWEQSWLAPPIEFPLDGGFLDPNLIPGFGEMLSTAFENYLPAIKDFGEMFAPTNSSVSIVEVDWNYLRVFGSTINFKVVTTSQFREATVVDDESNGWETLSLIRDDQSFKMRDEFIDISPGTQISTSVTKGNGSNEIMVFFPDNAFIKSEVTNDPQEDQTDYDPAI